MTPDEIVRRAALLLRSGAVPVPEFVGALDEPARKALRETLARCFKCGIKPGESLSGEREACCCGDCYRERDSGRGWCADCPVRERPRSLGKCFAGACATPATRYANGHALCERHASEWERRQAAIAQDQADRRGDRSHP